MLSIRKALLFTPAIVMLMPALFSCGNNGDYIYLKVLNSEDYIYKKEEKDDPEDLIVQFEKEYNSAHPNQKKVKVVYDTFDTMENMFNTLKTGKTKYDLVCASEYMIQKLASLDLITPLNKDNIKSYYNDSYTYETGGASPFIREKLKAIKCKNNTLDDYSVCYMWGTLGILYNPTYKEFVSRGYSKEEVSNDMHKTGWDVLWNSKYKRTIAIKDSMRDTYAIGVMHSFDDELSNASTFEDRNRIFNYGGEEDENAQNHIKTVQNDLLRLRENIFGFEVDSGKEDIVTGKIGIDTAWSGDAVHSMNEGDDEKTANLYYSIPDNKGTNLWFDCWCMQTGANEPIASAFLDFISRPDNATQNMDYIGYTSGVAGQEIFEYFEESYNEKYKEFEEEKTEYKLNYFFDPNSSETISISVPNSQIDRQIAAQFPKQEDVSKLMIMKDYGKNNDLILKMWEEVKHESLPTWAIILLSIEVAAILFGVGTFIIIKVKDKNRRKRRKA